MPEPPDMVAWFRVDERVTTSGQPSEAQLVSLATLGVRHIINLGLHSHERALADEAASVAALGIEYVHIPVAFDAPEERDSNRFCDAMAATGDEPVHVQCIVNARVSAFHYRYRRDVLGVEEADARASMEAIWQPGGVWAAFIGDEAAVALPHRPVRRRG